MKGIVPNEFMSTGIYHSDEKNYSRNYHRALVAFYLKLRPDDMKRLKPPLRTHKQRECPWEIPGISYISDEDIAEMAAQEATGNGMDCDTPPGNPAKKRSRAFTL